MQTVKITPRRMITKCQAPWKEGHMETRAGRLVLGHMELRLRCLERQWRCMCIRYQSKGDNLKLPSSEYIWKLGISKYTLNFISRKCQNLKNVKNALKGKKNDSLFSVKYLVLPKKNKMQALNFQTSAVGIKPEGILRINQTLNSLT